MIKKFYLLGFLLITCISIGLIIQYSNFNNIIKENNKLNITKSIEILGERINNSLHLSSQVINSTGELILLDMGTKDEMEEYFKKLKDINPIFNSIYYGDINNNLINSDNWMPPSHYDVKTRPWYIKAIREKGIVYSEVYIDAITNELTMTISKPIYNSDGKLLGVVSGDIFVKEIIKLVKKSKVDDKGYSFLIDGQGYILAHPNYKYDKYSELKNINDVSNSLFTDIKENSIGEKEVKLDEIDGYLSYEPIDGTDWIIGSFVSLDEYNRNDNHILRMFFIGIIIVITIFIAFLATQKRYFISPSYALENDIKNINMEKNIYYRIPLYPNDPFIPVRTSINMALNKAQDFFKQQQEFQEELIASNEELEASYGQLAAMEQELREQYIIVKQNEEKLNYLSYYDQLTGLYNRRFFEEQLKRLDIEKNLPLTLVMSDVNGLKLINDSFGHKDGDQLLKDVADVIKKGCRDNDIVSRMGGDEFVIILPNTNTESAENIIKRIKVLLNEKTTEVIDLSVSFGVASKYNINESIESILEKAEDNMYSNKLVEGPSMRSKTIDTIMKTLYEKNPREEAHSTRVALLCQQMGSQLDLTEEKIKELEMIGLLHDIGKVAIPDSVLEKEGPLTSSEWKEMKRHPEIGYRILNTINEKSKIAEYVLYHHERYDGKGYPKGLQGEEIPLISRIIAIADAYDAMISDRPYRKALSKETAAKEIIKNAGTQFDLKLSKIFVENILSEKYI